MTGPQAPYATPRATRQAVLAHAGNASHRVMASTRHRDLVDLATIAITQRLTAHELHIAIHHELLGQRLPLPDQFAVPDPEAWRIGYVRQAQGLPHLRGVGFDEAFALVKAMIDPILAGRRDGVWRPEARCWEPDGDGGGLGPRGVGTAS